MVIDGQMLQWDQTQHGKADVSHLSALFINTVQVLDFSINTKCLKGKMDADKTVINKIIQHPILKIILD